MHSGWWYWNMQLTSRGRAKCDSAEKNKYHWSWSMQNRVAARSFIATIVYINRKSRDTVTQTCEIFKIMGTFWEKHYLQVNIDCDHIEKRTPKNNRRIPPLASLYSRWKCDTMFRRFATLLYKNYMFSGTTKSYIAREQLVRFSNGFMTRFV